MWWLWTGIGLAVWLAVATPIAILLGRAVQVAERRAPMATEVRPVGLRAWTSRFQPSRRRAVPLPALGVALAALAVALETAGYLVWLSGGKGQLARLLAMEEPFSLPRLFVALLFTLAAVAAVFGAAAMPGRRPWWLAVGLVAMGIAAVKAGSNVHRHSLDTVNEAIGDIAAVAVSALTAAVVIAGLWYLSRTERRDRRRVLGVLSCYAVASVGLSSVSVVAKGTWGELSTAAATATYVEESAEALAGVAFLVAVLIGVAPRLVLPAAWVLRRRADAQTLSLPEVAPGRVQGAARL